jgi:fatty-acyl-CoA synthase
MPRWDRELAGRLISRWKVTHWTNIPTMVIDLLGSPQFASYDLSSLVYIGGGGAAMPQAVAQRLLELYGLRYVEGLWPDRNRRPITRQPARCPQAAVPGHPVHQHRCPVIDPDTLQEMPQGEAGEIIILRP